MWILEGRSWYLVSKWKRPATETGILETQIGPSRVELLLWSNNVARQVGGGRRLYPTTITTTVNSYFRDPEPKPPARNQGSESLSSVRSAPLASLHFPMPTPLPSPPLLPCPLQRHLQKAFLTMPIPRMHLQNKHLW